MQQNHIFELDLGASVAGGKSQTRKNGNNLSHVSCIVNYVKWTKKEWTNHFKTYKKWKVFTLFVIYFNDEAKLDTIFFLFHSVDEQIRFFCTYEKFNVNNCDDNPFTIVLRFSGGEVSHHSVESTTKMMCSQTFHDKAMSKVIKILNINETNGADSAHQTKIVKSTKMIEIRSKNRNWKWQIILVTLLYWRFLFHFIFQLLCSRSLIADDRHL